MSAAQAILEPAGIRVRDPVSGRSLWLAGMITDGRIQGETLAFALQFKPEHNDETRERLHAALLRQIAAVGWKGEVRCEVRGAASAPEAPRPDPVKGMSGPGVQPHGGPIVKQPIPGIRHIVAVASGKGGVGKSTVATNLAVSLAATGYRVGLMDADIYGPSLPLMMGVQGRPYANSERRILPLEGHGVRCMSIGFLVDEKEPVIWRGPMVMGVIRQFLQEVAWGELDVLLVDLPPGTGDAQLTMIQAVPLSGAVVVTTPQPVALLDAVRAIEMFTKLEVPILGIIENMSWLDLPGGGRMHPFGEGGGGRTARDYGVPLLAEVPLDPKVREGGDEGRPVALSGGTTAALFRGAAQAVVTRLGL